MPAKAYPNHQRKQPALYSIKNEWLLQCLTGSLFYLYIGSVKDSIVILSNDHMNYAWQCLWSKLFKVNRNFLIMEIKMKIKWFILSCLFGYQHSCFTHNLDKYTVLYPDLIEIVEKQCKNADQDQKLIIQEHVQALIDDIVINQRQTGRSYTFFSIENEFNRQEGDKESYVFYVILYVEFEPNIFDNISLCKKDKIQKMVVKHLLKLYDSKSIAFKKVLPGCCVSCIKIGIDAVSKHHKQ